MTHLFAAVKLNCIIYLIFLEHNYSKNMMNAQCVPHTTCLTRPGQSSWAKTYRYYITPTTFAGPSFISSNHGHVASSDI